jgi:AcrR family transcriptional regulator
MVERRRAEIIHAALKVFTERGYHAAGIADIAKELGVGHGTFYRYFRNKRDILTHVTNHTSARLATVLAAERPTESDTLAEYRAQVERIGAGMYDLFIDDPQVVRLLFIESVGADPEMTGHMLGFYASIGKGIEQYLRNGVDKGFLRADLDVEIVGHGIAGMIMAGALSMLTARDPRRNRDRWVATITTLMFEGIAPR